MLTTAPSFQGRVRMVKHKADGTKTADISFTNEVLDAAIVNLFNHHINSVDASSYPSFNYGPQPWVRSSTPSWRDTNAFMDYLFLGTGTTEPTPLDAGLESRSTTLAGKLALTGYGSNRPIRDMCIPELGIFASEIDMTFRYNEGEAQGVWTELGLAESQAYNHPFSRALIRDENGQPMSLTVLSDEFLTVFYTVRYQDGMQGVQTTTLTVGGVEYEATLQPALTTFWTTNITSSNSIPLSIWGENFPFIKAFRALSSIINSHTNNSSFLHYDAGFNPLTRRATYTFGLDPSDDDYNVLGINLIGNGTSGSGSSNRARGHAIRFSPPILKKADYRLMFNLQIQLAILGKPIANVRVTDATDTSLSFAWDPYDATEYRLRLYRLGNLVGEQTVTGTTATFTGLSSSLTYDFDIYATGGDRDSARVVIQGVTT